MSEPALAFLMFAALAVLVWSGLPVAVILAAVGFAFGLIGAAAGLVRPTDFGLIYYRVWGTLARSEDILWGAVPMLIFMGAVLEESGLARELLVALRRLLRRVPGGLPLAVTLIGILLAPAAGMLGAAVATLGLVALPTMLEEGYRPSLATGSVAAAGTLGVALPPGLLLFFLADAMGMQVPFVFLAMIGPAILLLALYVLYYGAVGRRDAHRARGGESAEANRTTLARAIVRSLAPPIALTVLIVGSIVAGWASPSESASLGAVGAVALGLLRGGLSVRALHRAIARTAVLTAMVFFIFIGASLFALIFRLLGGVQAVTGFLAGLHLPPWGTLAVVLAVIFGLGCFLDWLEIVVISFAIFRPALDGLDFSGHVDPPYLAFGWITVLVALTLQSSFLTPPFGFALFFVKGAAPARVRMADVYRGVVPFIVIQILVIACVAAVPQLATWLPERMLHLPSARSIQAWE